jgi:septal ring factor EnvC (AmiA/AmiB activator)
MASPPTIDLSALALDPVEALRGEHSQLEDWMRESFAALEAMHGELAEWQRDLTRRHAELDQREAAVAQAGDRKTGEARDFADVEQQLSQAREENRLLVAENAEQLQAREDMERQLGAAQAELRTVRRHAEELTLAFQAERERAMDEHRLWTSELREMRRVLRRQGQMLISLGASEPLSDDGEEDPEAETAAATDATDADLTPGDAAQAVELRGRAMSRRTGNQA